MKSEGLGSYVSQRRRLFSLTQTDLAKALGYTAQSISKFEAGESQISILVLPKLANLLNESLDDLLNQKANPAPLSVPNPQFEEKNLMCNLIALRQQKGFSQSKEAEILGVTKRSIINYEQGESYPSLDALCRLLTYHKISAKTFYFEQIEPLSLSKITVVSSRKPFRGLWIGLLTFAAVALVVGCTSPLWVPSLNRAGMTGSSTMSSLLTTTSSSSSSTNSNTSSSSSSAKSSSSTSSSSPSGSSSASSQSSSSSSDLSPYLPGLSKLYVTDADGNPGGLSYVPGTQVSLTFFSDSLKFTEANKDLYGFYFLLASAPDGVTLTTETRYSYVTLTIPSTIHVPYNFSVSIFVYSVEHKDSPVQGQGFDVAIYNPDAKEDLSKDFPGLKQIDLRVDTQPNYVICTPGDYQVRLVPTPSDYFSANNITYDLGLLSAHDGVSLKDGNLSIASYVSDQKNSVVRITLTSPTGRKYITETCKITVSNPKGEPNSDDFPGITGLYLTLDGQDNGVLHTGSNLLDVSIQTSSRCKLDLNQTNFYFAHSSSGYSGDKPIAVKMTGNDLKQVEMDIASSVPEGTLITTYLLLCRYSSSPNLTSNAFYITVKNNSTSASS